MPIACLLIPAGPEKNCPGGALRLISCTPPPPRALQSGGLTSVPLAQKGAALLEETGDWHRMQFQLRLLAGTSLAIRSDPFGFLLRVEMKSELGYGGQDPGAGDPGTINYIRYGSINFQNTLKSLDGARRCQENSRSIAPRGSNLQDSQVATRQ